MGHLAGLCARSGGRVLAAKAQDTSHTGPDRPHIPSSDEARGEPRAAGPVWGLSSAGRATESHSVGHRFDPDRLHHLRFASMAQPIVLWFARLRRDRLHQRLCGEAAKSAGTQPSGALAQLGERVLCKHEVTGSIPVGSTNLSARCLRAARRFHQREPSAEWVGSSGG